MGTPAGRFPRKDASTPLPSENGFGPIPADPIEYRVTVRYPEPLRPGRVQTISVSLAPLQTVDRVLDLGRKLLTEPMPLRLVIPGAVLLPAEQVLEPTAFGPAEAVFHVTPIAEGELPDCRLETFRHGKVTAIPLPLRSKSRRPLAWMVAMTLIVPLLLIAPACWPAAADDRGVEQAVAAWMPNVPVVRSSVSGAAQWAYSFLATTGRDLSLSFFAFAGLVANAIAWAVANRPRVVKVSGDPFLVTQPFNPQGKSSGVPPFLSPITSTDMG